MMRISDFLGNFFGQCHKVNSAQPNHEMPATKESQFVGKQENQENQVSDPSTPLLLMMTSFTILRAVGNSGGGGGQN